MLLKKGAVKSRLTSSTLAGTVLLHRRWLFFKTICKFSASIRYCSSCTRPCDLPTEESSRCGDAKSKSLHLCNSQKSTFQTAQGYKTVNLPGHTRRETSGGICAPDSIEGVANCSNRPANPGIQTQHSEEENMYEAYRYSSRKSGALMHPQLTDDIRVWRRLQTHSI